MLTRQIVELHPPDHTADTPDLRRSTGQRGANRREHGETVSWGNFRGRERRGGVLVIHAATQHRSNGSVKREEGAARVGHDHHNVTSRASARHAVNERTRRTSARRAHLSAGVLQGQKVAPASCRHCVGAGWKPALLPRQPTRRSSTTIRPFRASLNAP